MMMMMMMMMVMIAATQVLNSPHHTAVAEASFACTLMVYRYTLKFQQRNSAYIPLCACFTATWGRCSAQQQTLCEDASPCPYHRLHSQQAPSTLCNLHVDCACGDIAHKAVQCTAVFHSGRMCMDSGHDGTCSTPRCISDIGLHHVTHTQTVGRLLIAWHHAAQPSCKRTDLTAPGLQINAKLRTSSNAGPGDPRPSSPGAPMSCAATAVPSVLNG
ncbi:hypothetical protein COO60DRAFT_106208 [Scenedesmus sp. NREL 46B-D3]|nr:hypothetical protein COO60DRAFT_106208 [Scenedesmus sp. NREL 46B-D3]